MTNMEKVWYLGVILKSTNIAKRLMRSREHYHKDVNLLPCPRCGFCFESDFKLWGLKFNPFRIPKKCCFPVKFVITVLLRINAGGVHLIFDIFGGRLLFIQGRRIHEGGLYLRDTDCFVHLYGKIQSPRSIVKVELARPLHWPRDLYFSLQIAQNSQYPVYYLATEFLLLFATVFYLI